jgi:hypothetical protein
VRPRCPSHSSGSSEPVLAGPDDAAAAIRLSAPPADGPSVVVLLCDADHRLILAITVDGAPATAVPRVIDLVLQVAESGGVAAVVVGIVRPRLERLSRPEAVALGGLLFRCDAGRVQLLDVLLVGPRRWRSLLHLAAMPGEGEDGHQ